jgi:hypothetical protein
MLPSLTTFFEIAAFREVDGHAQGHPSRVMTAAIQMGDVANVAASRKVAQ